MMGVVSHFYRLIGPSFANLYLSILIAILISVIGLHNAMRLREKSYSEWLIQHFRQLRKHQQRTADQHEDNTYVVSQVIKICEEMELQSLLSYPHEHSKHCTKDCMLRHTDIFIIFGNQRSAPSPPSLSRSTMIGKDLGYASGAEARADDTNIDLATGISTSKTGDERGGDADSGPPKIKIDDDALDSSEMCREMEEGKGKHGLQLDQQVDPNCLTGIDEVDRSKPAESGDILLGHPDEGVSEKVDFDVTVTENIIVAEDESISTNNVVDQPQGELKESQHPEIPPVPSSPKVKGPAPQKKKGRKKW